MSDVSAADQVWEQKILPITGLCSALAALKPLSVTPATSVTLEVVHRVPDEPQSTTYFATRTQSTFFPSPHSSSPQISSLLGPQVSPPWKELSVGVSEVGHLTCRTSLPVCDPPGRVTLSILTWDLWSEKGPVEH